MMKPRSEVIPDPPFARWLLANPRSAPLWLVPRLILGAVWLGAGLEKLLHPDGIWVGARAGAAVSGFVRTALEGDASLTPEMMAWYATFLRESVLAHPAFYAYLVTLGEVLVGLALILGAFTGIAAFFGGFMNLAFMFAGTVGILALNPLMFMLTTWLVLGWKVAGWWGLDRWLLPALGVPGAPGAVFAAAHDDGPRAPVRPALS